jgi:hypothetical protein
MLYPPQIKEAVGIYSSEDSSSLVHIALIPGRVEILGHVGGEVVNASKLIRPKYKRSNGVIGKDNMDIVLAVPNQQIFHRNIKLPPVSDSRIEKMIRHEAQQNIPFPLEEVFWDYHLNKSDAEYDLSLFVAKKDMINNQVEAFIKKGITPTSVTPSSEALFAIVNKGTIIYPEGRSHSIIIADGKSYFLRTLPFPVDSNQRLIVEIERTFNFYKTQVSVPETSFSPLVHKGLNPELVQMLKDREKIEDIREISFNNFDGKSIADYIALGAAIAGAYGTQANLWRSVKEPCCDFSIPAKKALGFLRKTLDGASCKIRSLEERL